MSNTQRRIRRLVFSVIEFYDDLSKGSMTRLSFTGAVKTDQDNS